MKLFMTSVSDRAKVNQLAGSRVFIKEYSVGHSAYPVNGSGIVIGMCNKNEYNCSKTDSHIRIKSKNLCSGEAFCCLWIDIEPDPDGNY